MKISKINRLYHGTNQEFSTFDFSRARGFKDFGKGFYLTSNLSQAQKWAQKKARFGDKAYIYSYCIENAKVDAMRVLELLEYDEQWVETIAKCRLEGLEPDYDIIYDRMADNQFHEISDALQRYSNQELTAAEVAQMIRWNDENSADQFCFKTQNAIGALMNREMITLFKDAQGLWRVEDRMEETD